MRKVRTCTNAPPHNESWNTFAEESCHRSHHKKQWWRCGENTSLKIPYLVLGRWRRLFESPQFFSLSVLILPTNLLSTIQSWLNICAGTLYFPLHLQRWVKEPPTPASLSTYLGWLSRQLFSPRSGLEVKPKKIHVNLKKLKENKKIPKKNYIDETFYRFCTVQATTICDFVRFECCVCVLKKFKDPDESISK